MIGAGSGLLAGCRPEQTGPAAVPVPGRWTGAGAERGHRLRQAPDTLPAATGPLRRVEVLIVGAGIAGLACARGLRRAGIDDIALLELEDRAGGNSRGHQMGGMACPLGAHYLPLPGPQAPEVYQLLEELGLVQQRLGRPVFDERHLCHSPQERLFFEGQWHEGLLPPALTPQALAQQRRFEQLVNRAQGLGFALPSYRAPWTAAHAELDGQTFASWLDREGLDEAGLRWYLDYCCRDDFGAGTAEVSAWAGLHYFASRHGFHPPGSETGEREPVLTWPQGNAFLADAMAAALQEQLHVGRTVLRISPQRQQVDVLAWNEAEQRAERWQARELVLATPLFIAGRLLGGGPAPLRDAAAQLRYAPWLVCNLQLRGPLLQRLGAAPSWDNVIYGSAALGYVDAMHQSLLPHAAGATVLSAYWALPQARRGELLTQSREHWLAQMLSELSGVHPDLPQQLQAADLSRWGHAMSIPVPGIRGSAALAALRQSQGRLHFAHSDLAGYSVFEEAYCCGQQLAARLATARGKSA